MVEIYLGENGPCHKSQSFSSEDYDYDPEQVSKRFTKIYQMLKALNLTRDIDLKLVESGGITLRNLTPRNPGDVVLSELPALVYSTNGFCPFCKHVHSEFREESKDRQLREIERRGVERFGEVRKICVEGTKLKKMVDRFECVLEVDSDTFKNFDVRKLRLVLLFLYVQGQAEAKAAHGAIDPTGRTGLEPMWLEMLFDLHGDVSCESLRREERRYTAAEKILEVAALGEYSDIGVDKVSDMMSIVDTNSFELTLSEYYSGCSLYYAVSLINHSCDPNCGFVVLIRNYLFWGDRT